MATEFCENGNLLDLLRNGRGQFQDFFNENYQNASVDGNTMYANEKYKISTKDLLMWSVQVATGMEFLGTKRVVCNFLYDINY